jgi:hypothetical protein
VKPALLGSRGSAEISVSSLGGRLDSKNITILVTNPEGKKFYSKVNANSFSMLKFPNDFVGSSSSLVGNYTVLLVSKISSKILNALELRIVSSPLVSSFSDFVFGPGLAITIGLVASIITIIYQLGSQQNQDRARRLEDKAKWMLENTRYYMYLISDSGAIYSAFPRHEGQLEPSYNNLDSDDLLSHIIDFYKHYVMFRENTGFYYFDDFRSEGFIEQLDTVIFSMFDEMTDDYSQLKQFFDSKTKADLTSNPDFKLRSDRIHTWLLDAGNARQCFLNLLVYR